MPRGIVRYSVPEPTTSSLDKILNYLDKNVWNI